MKFLVDKCMIIGKMDLDFINMINQSTIKKIFVKASTTSNNLEPKKTQIPLKR